MYIIRDLRIDDLPACYQIVLKNWDPYVAGSAYREMADGFDHPSNWPPEYCVTEYNNEIVGVAGYRRALFMSNAWEMIWNNVRKDHQGRGLGKLMHEYRVDKIREAGGTLIIAMSSNLEFNLKIGFTSVQEIDGYHLFTKVIGPVGIAG